MTEIEPHAITLDDIQKGMKDAISDEGKRLANVHGGVFFNLLLMTNPKDAYEYLTERKFLPHNSAMIIIRGMFTEESIKQWQKETTDERD